MQNARDMAGVVSLAKWTFPGRVPERRRAFSDKDDPATAIWEAWAGDRYRPKKREPIRYDRPITSFESMVRGRGLEPLRDCSR